MSEKYRPSNGSEGDWFMGKFCHQCARANLDEDSGKPPCVILGLMLGYGIDDPQYPKEIIQDENGPRCTAFVHEDEELPAPRCEDTIDMFGGGG